MKNRKMLSEVEIDDLVVAEAEDDSAWEAPTKVSRKQKTSLSLPVDWIRKVIEERIQFEEAAFLGLKRDLAAKATS